MIIIILKPNQNIIVTPTENWIETTYIENAFCSLFRNTIVYDRIGAFAH